MEATTVAKEQTKEQTREQGVVKWFGEGSMGYGFIIRENGDELFVHFRNIEMSDFKTLHGGQLVEFSVGSSPKGDYAEHVVPLD